MIIGGRRIIVVNANDDDEDSRARAAAASAAEASARLVWMLPRARLGCRDELPVAAAVRGLRVMT